MSVATPSGIPTIDPVKQVVAAARAAVGRSRISAAVASTDGVQLGTATQLQSYRLVVDVANQALARRGTATADSAQRTEAAAPRAQRTSHDADIDRARKCVDHALARTRVLASGEIERQRTLLDRFRGLPVAFNPLRMLGQQGREGTYQALLAWLLDVDATHGLGDTFLLLFMAQVGITARGKIFHLSTPLKARVLVEAQFQACGEIASQEALRIDILLCLPDLAIPIELKVDAKESTYSIQSPGESVRGYAQAAAYGWCLRRMLQAVHRPAAVHGAAAENDNWRSSLQRMLGRHWDDPLRDWWSPQMRIAPVLIHGATSDACKPNRASREHDVPVRHLSWVAVERLLASTLDHYSIEAPQRALLLAFRQTILEHTASENVLSLIEYLRLISAEPSIAFDYPFKALRTLRDVSDSFEGRLECERTKPTVWLAL